MVITDDSLQYLENLEVNKKQARLSGIIYSMGITYVREKQYIIDILVQGFDYSVLPQSTYNHLKTRLSATQYPHDHKKWRLNEKNCTVVPRSVVSKWLFLIL